MNGLLHPVGPEPAAVYWRRRAMVVGGIIVLVVIIVMIANALAGRPNKNPQAGPENSPKPTVSATPTKAELAACEAKDLSIILVSTKDQFAPGEPVVLNAEVTNSGKQACAVVPSSETIQLHVVSGNDVIFDTIHCAVKKPTPPGEPITIQPGVVGIVPVTWDATRSVDGCADVADGDQPKRNRNATYVATVKIDGAESDQTRFILSD